MDAPIVLLSDQTAEQYAEDLGARLEALGCSKEHIESAKADALRRAIHRGEAGDPQLKGEPV